MSMSNTKAGYGWLTIALHWLGAIAVIAMFAIGINAYLAGEANDREARRALMALHIGLGALVALPLLARVAWHYLQPQPTPIPQPRAFAILASVTQNLMLAAIVILCISGPLAVFSAGRAINAFDLFAIPSPFAARNNEVHELAETAHAIGRLMLLVFVPLHLLGALKHLLIDRDGVLQRMLAPVKGP